MNETGTNTQTIADEVTSWPGIEIDSDEPGELAFKLGRREIGHLHGEHVAHFSFPKHVDGADRAAPDRPASRVSRQAGTGGTPHRHRRRHSTT